MIGTTLINEQQEDENEIGIILTNNIEEIENEKNLLNENDQDDEDKQNTDTSNSNEEDEEEEDDNEKESIKIEVDDSIPKNLEVTPLPKMKILSIFIIMLCDAINSLSIFPYVNFLVESFNLTPDRNKLGYYVGILASSYYIAQLVSSFFWGWFSNYKGRRPSLLMGLVGSMICLTGVGLSKNYPMVMMFRFLSGLLNGNVSVAKTMLGEITDSTNQAKAFSFIGLSWGVGGIVAPLIGGYTSNVCGKHPDSFDPNTFVCKFPYLLPNLICVMFSLLGLCLGYFYLQESKTFSYSKLPSSKSSSKLSRKRIKSSFKKIVKKSNNLISTIKINSIVRIKNHHNKLNENSDSILLDNDQVANQHQHHHHHHHHQILKNSTGIEMNTLKDSTSSAVTEDGNNKNGGDLVIDENQELPRSLKELYKDKGVMYSCIIYAFLGFLFTIFEEIFPNWSPNKRVYHADTGITTGGGFGFKSSNIGMVQSSAGIFALLIQTFVFPKMVKYFGLLKSFRISLLIALPTWIFLPELSKFTEVTDVTLDAPHPTIFWVLLFPIYLFQSFASEITFICIIVMISNSAEPRDMALVNSIGMFLVSISRSFGPTIAGTILAFSLSHNYPYPIDYHMVFNLEILITLCLYVASFLLPESLNYTKERAIVIEKILSGELSENDLLKLKEQEIHH